MSAPGRACTGLDLVDAALVLVQRIADILEVLVVKRVGVAFALDLAKAGIVHLLELLPRIAQMVHTVGDFLNCHSSVLPIKKTHRNGGL